MNEINIVPMQPGNVEEAAEVLSKAFINTPFTMKIIGGNTEKHRRMLHSGFKNMISKKPGESVVAKEKEEIVGVMRMVKWPDCQNSIPKGVESIPLMLFAGKVFGRLKEARGVWGMHDPKKPHWHVDPIGVLPKRQGLGIGSLLMKYYCDKVDFENMPAYHETDQPQNVRFYEKHGYTVIKTVPIFGITNWFLLREPRQKTAFKGSV